MASTLLIDDEPLTTQALRKVIESNFTDIEILAEATNGRRAWELIQTDRPDFIVADIRMPEMDGLDLVDKIRQAGLPIKVILVTAYGEFEYAQRAIRLGAFGYFVKPFVQQELINEIHRLLEVLASEQEANGYKRRMVKAIPIVEESVLKRYVTGTVNRMQQEEFLDLVGERWDRCRLDLFRLSAAGRPELQLEEVTRISIIEELKKNMEDRGEYGVAFFQGPGEIVLIRNEAPFPQSAVEQAAPEYFIQAIVKYIPEQVASGTCGSSRSLEQLSEAYQEALADLERGSKGAAAPDEGEHETPGQQDMLIAKALEYCRQHYTDDISLQKAADHVHINKYYFCSLFKEKLDTTFWDYITRLRIDRAAELLVTTPMRVQEIAFATGYLNASHFGRIFKETAGITPAEYRRKHTAEWKPGL